MSLPDTLRRKYKRAIITMAGAALFALAFGLLEISGLMNAPADRLWVDLLTFFISASTVVFLILLLIFYLIWLSHFHGGLQQLDLSYPISPRGAVARFLIPGYNLWGVWNVHSTYAERLSANSDTEKRSFGRRIRTLLPFYYVALLGGSILDRLASQKEIPKSTGDWLSSLATLLTVAWIGTWLVMTSTMEKTLSRDLVEYMQLQSTQGEKAVT